MIHKIRSVFLSQLKSIKFLVRKTRLSTKYHSSSTCDVWVSCLQHQVAHWKEHKGLCKLVTDLAKSGEPFLRKTTKAAPEGARVVASGDAVDVHVGFGWCRMPYLLCRQQPPLLFSYRSSTTSSIVLFSSTLGCSPAGPCLTRP